MKISFFPDMTPYNWVDSDQRVRGIAACMLSDIPLLLGVIPMKNYRIKFVVLMAATIKIVSLFDMTPCSLVHR
jgi:hypothetical protein